MNFIFFKSLEKSYFFILLLVLYDNHRKCPNDIAMKYCPCTLCPLLYHVHLSIYMYLILNKYATLKFVFVVGKTKTYKTVRNC